MKFPMLSRVFAELLKALAIAKKDACMYYFQPQSFMMGILFPAAMFFSFSVGRNLPAEVVIPGIMAVTILFSSSSIGPLAVPMERRTKTYERMIVAPISPLSIVFGEICAGIAFGVVIACLPLAIGLIFFGVSAQNLPILIASTVLVAFEFSAMGVMFSAVPTENPANAMMLVNLVRLPLIFVSGIFVTAAEMGVFGWITWLSPLTYGADLFRSAVSGRLYGLIPDVLGVVLFTVIFLALSVYLHERNRTAG
ncbi:MAG TPA: ABC transporter permease [Methanocella sp.]|nr:ABC transporter permease [Methanocella sp.]